MQVFKYTLPYHYVCSQLCVPIRFKRRHIKVRYETKYEFVFLREQSQQHKFHKTNAYYLIADNRLLSTVRVTRVEDIHYRTNNFREQGHHQGERPP